MVHYFINRTRKHIIHIEPYNIVAILKDIINTYGWTMDDRIDMLDDICDLVEQGYIIVMND